MVSKAGRTKSISGRYSAGEQKSRHAVEEFGPGKSGFIFCPQGEAVYFKKSWHHVEKFFRNPPNLRDKNIRFKLCPAHQMLKNKQCEGEVIVENVPPGLKRELLNLIENFGERAMRKDVLDRILMPKTEGRKLKVWTSENQLAQKIGNKIYETFRKKADTKILHAKEGDMVRVRIIFRA